MMPDKTNSIKCELRNTKIEEAFLRESVGRSCNKSSLVMKLTEKPDQPVFLFHIPQSAFRIRCLLQWRYSVLYGEFDEAWYIINAQLPHEAAPVCFYGLWRKG